MVLRKPAGGWLRHLVVATGGDATVSVGCYGTHGGDDADCGQGPNDDQFEVHVYSLAAFNHLEQDDLPYLTL